jgi:nucleoside-diphosphate-sugar epimerase
MRRRVPNTAKIEQLLAWKPSRTLDGILDEVIEDARLEIAEQAHSSRPD